MLKFTILLPKKAKLILAFHFVACCAFFLLFPLRFDSRRKSPLTVRLASVSGMIRVVKSCTAAPDFVRQRRRILLRFVKTANKRVPRLSLSNRHGL
jgi:hypothetical protein